MGLLDRLLGRGKKVASEVGEKIEDLTDRDKKDESPPAATAPPPTPPPAGGTPGEPGGGGGTS